MADLHKAPQQRHDDTSSLPRGQTAVIKRGTLPRKKAILPSTVVQPQRQK